MKNIVGWYIKGINFNEAPASLDELRACGKQVVLVRADLQNASKWEPLFQGRRHEAAPGWVSLEALASFRRGIATGANGFFLLSKDRVLSLGINLDRCLPCVGKASDVPGLIYRFSDFCAAANAGNKLFLLNLSDPLTDSEKLYIRHGEQMSLTSRFLLANRRPWYSMEQRPVAPIWAAVFGRSDLKFVFNEAGVRSLTNFHCIYPKSADVIFQQALTLCLNARSVREFAKLHGRVYGGGLNKFEPNDLKSLQVPDLRGAPAQLLKKMSKLLGVLNDRPGDASLQQEADALCAQAAQYAARA